MILPVEHTVVITCPAAGLGTIAHERATRLESRRNEGRESPAVFEAALVPFAGTPIEFSVRAAHAFASALDYTHPGLSPTSYLAHPIRICAIALRLSPADVRTAILSLLHNVYEVSSVARSSVVSAFGAAIGDGIDVLTVDRSDRSRPYLETYYRRISEAPPFVRVVKVLDKLDNLFLLGLNADDRVREMYLAEIEEFVLPMAKGDAPVLLPYLSALTSDARARGFFGPGV